MKNKLLFCALGVTAIALLSATVIWALGARDDVRDDMRYDVLAERVFEGAVENRAYLIDGLLYFPLKTSDATVQVQIGPKEFVDHSGFKLNPGDMLTVIGMPLVTKERKIVLAREVRTKIAVLVVRDRTGAPMWETDRPFQMDPERGKDAYRLCEIIK
jgi:hypothetical protein